MDLNEECPLNRNPELHIPKVLYVNKNEAVLTNKK
jgi:hypothetical protein